MTEKATTTVPTRRQFLVLGGAAVAGAAVLGACSSSPVVNSSGTLPTTLVPPTAPPVTVSADERTSDVTILRTSTSLAVSIEAFYTKMLASTLVTTPAVKTWATTMQTHAGQHVQQLNNATTASDGKAYDKPSTFVDKNLIEPQFKLAKSEADLITLAATVEQAAAATASLAVGSLAGQAARQAIMAVGTTNARQTAVWNILNSPDDVSVGAPNALLARKDALGVDAQVK